MSVINVRKIVMYVVYGVIAGNVNKILSLHQNKKFVAIKIVLKMLMDN
jgi:hypothetical protein